ncbi:MAG: DUF1963 domain-containing protein [Planctomycetota bacterium]
MLPQRLIDQIRSSSLRDLLDEIHAAARPAVGLSPIRATEPVPIGASKVGGDPDLPINVPWPRGQIGAFDDLDRPDDQTEDTPCDVEFLAQIRLNDLEGLPLPRGLAPTGLLSVFYSTDRMPWRSGWRMVWSPASAQLKRRAVPPGRTRIREHALRSSILVTLPESLDIPESDIPDSARQEPAEGISYWEVRREVRRGRDGEIATLQLGGFGLWAQDDPTECPSGDERQELLLQVDSSRALNWMWCDDGALHWFGPEGLLAQRRFDDLGFELQC